MRDRVTVDSVAFARDARELRGKVAIADLTRLHDALSDRSGEVDYRLSGSTDKDGVASLHLDIDAALSLICQRCLGPVRFGLQSARSFELVPRGRLLGDPAEEPDDVERIEADPNLDVLALVEEEIILSLPMVAMHGPNECVAPESADGINEMKSPFSSLAGLKRQ